MSKNFDGIKTQRFGCEVESTGLTRSAAAKAISKVLNGEVEHEGGSYDKYTVKDKKGRKHLFQAFRIHPQKLQL